MSEAKDKSSGSGKGPGFEREGPGLFRRIIERIPEVTAPSRKVDDGVKDFNIPKTNMTSVVKTQSGDTMTWELYNSDIAYGKKVLEVTDDGGGLRIHIGQDKPVLGFVDGEWVVMGKPMERVEKVPMELSVTEMAERAGMGTTITDVADTTVVQPTGQGKNTAARIVAARTARMKVKMEANRETIREGKHVVMQELGKKYLDSIGPTEGEDPMPANSDKDDDTAAPGINESQEGWYGGGDPRDDGEDGGDEQDEKDEYDRANEISSDMYSRKSDAYPLIRYPEHCQHCALKDLARAYGIVRTRMEHRAELLISLRTTARELLIQSGVKEEMKSILRRFTLDNTLSQTERLKVSDVMGDGYEDALMTDRLGGYDVIQVDNVVIGSRWRIGIWKGTIDGKQLLLTCEKRDHGAIAGDQYASYDMVRNAVEILNGEGEKSG